MKKKIIILVILIFAVIIGVWGDFRLRDINYAYKDLRLEEIMNEVGENFNIIDEAGSCEYFEDEKRYCIWVGVVVEENINYDEMKNKIERLYGENSGFKCKPYSLDFANSRHFTGIQKEIFDDEGNMLKIKDGVYFIYKTYKPIINYLY